MKINWTYVSEVPGDVLPAQSAYAHGRNIPPLGGRPVKPDLAVVGGAPDLKDYLEELRAFPGEIWAINGAWRFLKSHGIESAFFTTDPHERVIELARGAAHAVLASQVHPGVWDVVQSAEMFDLGFGEGQVVHGPSTATAAPHVALIRGHERVTFYGCSSSYIGGKSHAYQSDGGSKLLITCGGETYLTDPRLFGQAEFLAAVIRAAPHIYLERSGGLLRALAQHEEYDVTAATRDIHQAITRANDGHIEEKAA